jgi:hypothetical protein
VKTTQHMKVVSGTTLHELIQRVEKIPNIARFHDLILPTGSIRNQYNGIPYRRWKTLEGETRYDTCVELQP